MTTPPYTYSSASSADESHYPSCHSYGYDSSAYYAQSVSSPSSPPASSYGQEYYPSQEAGRMAYPLQSSFVRREWKPLETILEDYSE
ncbi:hypothetical protein H4R35_005856 [Dimargaris xerosporica]|nr:hypothetical protein H4R35_005856 [Dimargaris xerosporica]